MLKAPTEFIIIFIIVSVIFMLALVFFIFLLVYKYQQKQNAYFRDIEALKDSHKNALLQSQLEIQEQTILNISREIHDNIGQKLTLAKLHLNTLGYESTEKQPVEVKDSIMMISEAINDLTNLSRSMNSDILLNNGLIRALEHEAELLTKSGLYEINLQVSGDPVFLDASSELILFRIVQEAVNNIIKHAAASVIEIGLHYGNELLIMSVADNGKGFQADQNHYGAGLLNMKKRAAMLKGVLQVSSIPNLSTQIKIEIPIYEKVNSL